MTAFASAFKNVGARLFNNPVLLKELKIGLREKRIFWVQTIYLLLLGIVTIFYFLNIADRSHYSYYQDFGKNFFYTMIVLQWFLVVFISPSLTSASISSEREKKTYDMLLVTPLRPLDIIWGKLCYAASYVFLLLFSSMPLISMVFLLGGISPIDVVINYFALMLWSLIVSLIALFFSSRESRTQMATSQSYGVLILTGIFFTAPYLAYFFESGRLMNFGTTPEERMIWTLIYINLAWFIMFLSYKTANNLRPSARNVLALHRLFILVFSINTIIGLFWGFSFIQSNLYYKTIGEEIAILWGVFSFFALFSMGCFVVVHKFLSQKEMSKLKKSPTNHPLYFPFFFIGASILTAVISYYIGAPSMDSIVAVLLFSIILGSLILISSCFSEIITTKLNKSHIYFMFFTLVTFIPLLTNSLASANYHYRSDMGMPWYSLNFISPQLSLASIFIGFTDKDLHIMLGRGATQPAYVLCFLFYPALAVAVYIFKVFVLKLRKNSKSK